jgi:hypothetical protein
MHVRVLRLIDTPDTRTLTMSTNLQNTLTQTRAPATPVGPCWRCVLWLLFAAVMLTGCQTAPRNMPAVHAYYQYEFTAARENLRNDVLYRNDEQVLLNSARLGMAALADGDLVEAEYALGRSFELLSTAGLNADRTTAAILTHEGVRIWKGEPFEQAMMYYYVAALYATMGDWDNVRAASSNALFRLTDFGQYQSPEELVRRAAADDEFLNRGYTAVDTNFTLGFLMQGIGAKLSHGAGSDDLFDAAVDIDPQVEPIADVLRTGHYNTLLLVDYGKGPTKVAYGPDNALVKFVQQEPGHVAAAHLLVAVGQELYADVRPVTNLSQMASDHRWNNLEDIRRAKSAIGDVLLTGGLVATSIGLQEQSWEVALAGVGAMLLGAMSKSGARADTRYLEYLPQSVYLVPLWLNDVADLTLQVGQDVMVVSDIVPGSEQAPTAVYVRMNGPGSPQPPWMTETWPVYSNDHTGVWVDDELGYPWILGGRDVSSPTRQTLEAYHANGFLLDYTVNDLRDLYHAEGITIGTGDDLHSDAPSHHAFRHILEGGSGLFTPHPGSMGYKRLMFAPRPAYQPQSELVRNAAQDLQHQSSPTLTHSMTP